VSAFGLFFFWVVLPLGFAVVGGLLGGRDGVWRAVALSLVVDVALTLWWLFRRPRDRSGTE
jgi:hypothetical protein